jgi:hypothetical protein
MLSAMAQLKQIYFYNTDNINIYEKSGLDNFPLQDAFRMITSEKAIKSESFIDGNEIKADLMFSKKGIIRIAHNTTLWLKNIRILNIRQSSFVFEDTTSRIVFENVALYFLEDFIFNAGTIKISDKTSVNFTKSPFAKQKLINISIVREGPQKVTFVCGPNERIIKHPSVQINIKTTHSQSSSSPECKPNFAQSQSDTEDDNSDDNDEKK